MKSPAITAAEPTTDTRTPKVNHCEQPQRLLTDSAQIAIVHEWLAQRAGSELLFEVIGSIFPEADVFALTRSPDHRFDFSGRHVRTTPLDYLPSARERRHITLPLMPLAWRAVRRRAYDLVLTSTHAFAREFVRPSDGIHINYVHAPMRYAWSPELDGRAADYGWLGNRAMAAMRHIDKRSVTNVDSFAANSSAVAERIHHYYGRQATVIHPPVDTEYFAQAKPERHGYLLAASRFIPYKRHDLAIEVAAKLDLPLILAGSGPEEPRLRDLADEIHPEGVTFEIQPGRDRLRALMAGADAFLFPPNEDFGIIVPEVQATGTPVVALRAGGSLDTVADGVSGVLADEQTVESFAAATARCLDLKIEPESCRTNANQFSEQNFEQKIRDWFERALSDGISSQ